jgi:hypothetical protein
LAPAFRPDLLTDWQSDDDYERVLSELDDRIHHHEIAIAEAKLQYRKVIALLTTYSVMLYVFWLLSFFFVTWPTVYMHVGAIPKVAPVFLVPIGFARPCKSPFYAAQHLQRSMACIVVLSTFCGDARFARSVKLIVQNRNWILCARSSAKRYNSV